MYPLEIGLHLWLLWFAFSLFAYNETRCLMFLTWAITELKLTHCLLLLAD